MNDILTPGFITVRGREIIKDVDVEFLVPQYVDFDPVIYYDESWLKIWGVDRNKNMVRRLLKAGKRK